MTNSVPTQRRRARNSRPLSANNLNALKSFKSTLNPPTYNALLSQLGLNGKISAKTLSNALNGKNLDAASSQPIKSALESLNRRGSTDLELPVTASEEEIDYITRFDFHFRTLTSSNDIHEVGLVVNIYTRWAQREPASALLRLSEFIYAAHRYGGAIYLVNLCANVVRPQLRRISKHNSIPPTTQKSISGTIAIALNEGGYFRESMAIFNSITPSNAGDISALPLNVQSMLYRNMAHCAEWKGSPQTTTNIWTDRAEAVTERPSDCNSLANTKCELHLHAGRVEDSFEAIEPLFIKAVDHISRNYTDDRITVRDEMKPLSRPKHQHGTLILGIIAGTLASCGCKERLRVAREYCFNRSPNTIGLRMRKTVFEQANIGKRIDEITYIYRSSCCKDLSTSHRDILIEIIKLMSLI